MLSVKIQKSMVCVWGGRYKEISRKGGRICELLKDRKKKRDWERRRKRREREIERKCI